ncbi:MAG: pyrimidine reductase family protein [Streptosporangiales bacterium]|nr:pyrimidine reductase family protein [Streptosporangiales bacterium]
MITAPGDRPGGLPDDAGLARLYAGPPGRWLRANMVTSADGAATVDGLSGGLSSPGDRRVFWTLRGLADVILVGAGTTRAEGYRPTRDKHDLWGPLGLRKGRPAAPPIAVVSRSLELDPAAPFIAGAPGDARTIVITCASAPASRREALSAVADVIVAGEHLVDLPEAVSALAARGLGQILCEGGPHLLGQLAGAGLLDELCLTISPVLAGPGAPGVVSGAPFGAARRLRLSGVLEEDGTLFCRYLASR